MYINIDRPIPCHLSNRVGHRVPMVGFLEVSFIITGLNRGVPRIFGGGGGGDEIRQKS